MKNVVLVVVVALAGVLFWQYSQNGRYALHERGAMLLVLDTRTGDVTYRFIGEPKSVVLRQKTGWAEVRGETAAMPEGFELEKK